MMGSAVVTFLICAGTVPDAPCRPVEVQVSDMPALMCESGLGGQMVAAYWKARHAPRHTVRDIKCKMGMPA